MIQNDFIKSLLNDYSSTFDVYAPHSLCGREYAAYCYFTSRGERFVLIKRAVIWAAETNEHVLIINAGSFGAAAAGEFEAMFPKLEAELVKPHREHMYSYITIIAVCSDVAPTVSKIIKKTRFCKNYKLTLHGYCAGRLAVADLSSGNVYANAAGKPLLPYLKKKMKIISDLKRGA